MAEKVISPGVFTNEIDQAFLPAAIGEIGAALVGPTVKGPAMRPTVVSSYSEFQQVFGSTFQSGSSFTQYLTSHAAKQYLKHGNALTVVRVLEGSYTVAAAAVHTGSGNNYTGSRTPELADNAADSSFKLHTLSHGAILNNRGNTGTCAVHTGSNNTLASGSVDNLRWEIPTLNQSKGTFTLLIRQGSDTEKRKQVLETWNDLSLDPNANNYIAKRIGDSSTTLAGTVSEPYVTENGTFPNKSKYVRVEVLKKTPTYLDTNGNISENAFSASLPGLGSGSFHGSFNGGDNGYGGFDGQGNLQGTNTTATNYTFYNNITTETQGFAMSADGDGTDAYTKAVNLLKNQDAYDINLLFMPGIIASRHGGIVSTAIDAMEDRNDAFFVIDPVTYGSGITDATTEAESRDTNFAAMYWPWVQIPDDELGLSRFVPPSVVIPGIYAFNDKVAQPWFAPAGLNRGGIDVAIQAERKLTHANRDTLYNSSVNPIATFPGQGVCVWGQKTLQKKSSALDRVNVRRLLIKVKKFIASSSRFLVFEQNNAQTRGRFLNIVNPFLEQVQAQSGLTAFKVVMDETNNTPDVVDRNILYGQLFLQPTRTAEFIVLDFTIQPTGATFPE